MKSLLLLLSIFFILGPNADAKKSDKDKSGAPSWVNNVSKGCKRSELCAVGTGTSRSSASRNARVSLAKVFGNKISSKFDSKLSATGSKVSEKASEDIQEITEEVMEGVEIRKFHEDRLSFYALAVINKRKAANGFKSEILKIDAKMSAIADDDSRSSGQKLENLYVARDQLHKRYEFLSGMSIDPPISYEQIFKSKKQLTSNIIVHVYLDEDEPKLVESTLTKLFSDSGYRITTGQVRKKIATHVVTGEFTSKEQYMKVAGFKKHKFFLKLTARDDQKVESGHLVYSGVSSGRNKQQAYEKVLPKVESFLRENISKLNIE